MFYYDGQHLTTKVLDFQAYDDDCVMHDQWMPIRSSELSDGQTVAETLSAIRQQFDARQASVYLENDCFVDYVVERSNDRKTQVMCPGRAVELFVERDQVLRGIPLSGMYQHEYREIDESFPYQTCTLSQLGVPAHDVLHVLADGQDYYLEMVA